MKKTHPLQWHQTRPRVFCSYAVSTDQDLADVLGNMNFNLCLLCVFVVWIPNSHIAQRLQLFSDALMDADSDSEAFDILGAQLQRSSTATPPTALDIVEKLTIMQDLFW